MSALASLVTRWRHDAARVRTLGLSGGETIDRLADELEAALRSAGNDSVTLTEGAEISGYSADHLGRLIREGELENVGRKHAPRVRVMDLPRKPGCGSADRAVPVLQLERGGRRGLEKAVERRRVRVQRGGDAS